MGASEHPLVVRRAVPADAEAILSTVTGPKAIPGTLQVPYPSVERGRKRAAEFPPGDDFLAATVAGEVAGNRDLHRASKSPRRGHVGNLGVTVRDNSQGRGVGTASMNAAIDLADGWRNRRRLELGVDSTISRESPSTADLASRWNGHAARRRFVTDARRVYDLEAASRACDQAMSVACGQPMKEAAP